VRELKFTARFEADYKRVNRNPEHRNFDFQLTQVVDLLLLDKLLPIKFLDHPLKGRYIGTRECHLKPDLLLIYSKTELNELVLIRIGSHSQLF
jgi:mRNA interferase YafQ